MCYSAETRVLACIVSKILPYRKRKPEEAGGDAHGTNGESTNLRERKKERERERERERESGGRMSEGVEEWRKN